jgi:hypothetical protein
MSGVFGDTKKKRNTSDVDVDVVAVAVAVVAIVPSTKSLLHENHTDHIMVLQNVMVETDMLPMPLCSLASEIDSLEAHLTVELRPNRPGQMLVCFYIRPLYLSIPINPLLKKQYAYARSIRSPFPVPCSWVETSCPLSFPLSRVVG